MDPDTEIGGKHAAFPHTQASAVRAAASADPAIRERAFERLIGAYWKPAYKHVRVVHKASNEDAKELVQGFFARALEKGWFARYDARRASFRTYLRTCLDGHVADERAAARREKRGGNELHVSLDFDAAEEELAQLPPDPRSDPDAQFHREWMRALFAEAVERTRRELRAAGHTAHLALFERLDLQAPDRPEGEKPSYAELAAELGISVSQVTNHLALARRTFRSRALDALRELCATDEELEAETAALFGERRA